MIVFKLLQANCLISSCSFLDSLPFDNVTKWRREEGRRINEITLICTFYAFVSKLFQKHLCISRLHWTNRQMMFLSRETCFSPTFNLKLSHSSDFGTKHSTIWQYKRFTSSAWFGYLVNWIPVWDAQDDAANTWSTAPSSRFSASSLIFDFPRKVPFFACRLLHFILLLHHRKQTNSWEECLTKDSFTCIPFTFPSSLKCRFVQNVHLDLAEQDLIWLLLVFLFPRESWRSLWNRYVFLRCAYVVAPHVEGIFSFSTTIMPQSSAHLLLLMNLILFLSSNDSNKKSDKVC